MRVAFVYSIKDQGLVNITKHMMALFEKSGHTVKAIEVENFSSPISFRPFDLVLVGANIVSFFGGKISQEIVKFLQGVNGMEGKKSVAYVRPALFGTDKALRRLMGYMESQGAFVVDFEAIKGEKEAEELVRRHL